MEIIHQKTIQTPLGEMIACAVDEGICLLEFTDRKNIEKQLKSLSKALNAEIIEKEHEHFKQLENELNEYFEGKEARLKFRYSSKGLSFRRKSGSF